MNEPVYFEIQATDPERGVRFYSAAFGWRFEKVPSLPIEYYRIETNGIMG